MDTSELFNPSTTCHVDMSTPPVSPPMAIDFSSLINIGSLAGIQCITLNHTTTPLQQQQQQRKHQPHQQQQQQQRQQPNQIVSQNVGSSASSVVNISNLNKNKVPIPKITKTGKQTNKLSLEILHYELCSA
jgi:hypothetical protein